MMMHMMMYMTMHMTMHMMMHPILHRTTITLPTYPTMNWNIKLKDLTTGVSVGGRTHINIQSIVLPIA